MLFQTSSGLDGIFGFLNGLNLLGNIYLWNGVLWRFVIVVLSMYFGKNITNR